MASDLCKKHSFGYEPLRVIGLSVAGKDCLLCLAEENDQLQAENKQLKEAIKAALRIEKLWLPEGVYGVETKDECIAVHKMHTKFLQVLKEK